MFGFHKSKIYRSNEGCCICKTKSSSSRFTDSSRYEENFSVCFGWVFSRHRSYSKHSQRNAAGILSQFGASPNEISRETFSIMHLADAFIRHFLIWVIDSVLANTCSVFHVVICLVVCQRIGLETSAMLVCCWWNAGRNYHMDRRKTGTM